MGIIRPYAVRLEDTESPTPRTEFTNDYSGGGADIAQMVASVDLFVLRLIFHFRNSDPQSADTMGDTAKLSSSTGLLLRVLDSEDAEILDLLGGGSIRSLANFSRFGADLVIQGATGNQSDPQVATATVFTAATSDELAVATFDFAAMFEEPRTKRRGLYLNAGEKLGVSLRADFGSINEFFITAWVAPLAAA